MLIQYKKLDSEKQALCRQNGWIALDPKTGAYLRQSKLEHNYDKQYQYILKIPTLMARVIWAKTDKEAITIANCGVK